MRRIIEGAKAQNLKTKTVFIDFKKAFDSVHRGLSTNILKAYGIPEILEELIADMYTGTMAKVITADLPLKNIERLLPESHVLRFKTFQRTNKFKSNASWNRLMLLYQSYCILSLVFLLV